MKNIPREREIVPVLREMPYPKKVNQKRSLELITETATYENQGDVLHPCPSFPAEIIRKLLNSFVPFLLDKLDFRRCDKVCGIFAAQLSTMITSTRTSAMEETTNVQGQ